MTRNFIYQDKQSHQQNNLVDKRVSQCLYSIKRTILSHFTDPEQCLMLEQHIWGLFGIQWLWRETSSCDTCDQKENNVLLKKIKAFSVRFFGEPRRRYSYSVIVLISPKINAAFICIWNPSICIQIIEINSPVNSHIK